MRSKDRRTTGFHRQLSAQIGTLDGSHVAGEENQAVANFSYELSEDHGNANVVLAENVADSVLCQQLELSNTCNR